MAELKGSKTHQNLKDAFAGESMANRRYLYFAKQADIEGYPEIAGNFRDTAEGETGHAHGHMDYLKKAGDPATGEPFGDTSLNLRSAVAGETHEYTDMYPGMAKAARAEGFKDIADWFETLAKAEKSHAGKFSALLKTITLIGRGRADPMAQVPIAYAPTDGISYDPVEPVYWDPSGLAKEVERVFEICHGCRMCFKYCDSFPTLFSLIDDRHEGDVRNLTSGETERVMDACFQCKLCEVQCPYTPRDGHAFQLDFPKLVHRYKAHRAKKRPLRLRDRIFADPDRAARLARMSGGLANALSRVRPHRWLLEKTLGIHRDKDLPPFAGTTFERWAEKSGKIAAKPGGEAVLFPTCYVQNNEPEIGRDTLEVLVTNGIDVRCAKGLACCGMPAWEQGDLETLRAKARVSLDVLMPFVEADAKVVVINPTCSMMMRREWPTLLEGGDRERAERLSKSVVDPSELLWSIRDEKRFRTDVRSKPSGKIACHAPCHLRAQGIGFRARDLYRKLFGQPIALVSECSGHDGTYAMKVEGYEPSRRIGSKAFGELKEAEAAVCSTDCPLAAIQIRQHAGLDAMHPMTILAKAYRGDPLP